MFAETKSMFDTDSKPAKSHKKGYTAPHWTLDEIDFALREKLKGKSHAAINAKLGRTSAGSIDNLLYSIRHGQHVKQKQIAQLDSYKQYMGIAVQTANSQTEPAKAKHGQMELSDVHHRLLEIVAIDLGKTTQEALEHLIFNAAGYITRKYLEEAKAKQ